MEQYTVMEQYMKFIEKLIGLLSAEYVGDVVDVRGYSDDEIHQLQKSLGYGLPIAFVCFLKVMGRSVFKHSPYSPFNFFEMDEYVATIETFREELAFLDPMFKIEDNFLCFYYDSDVPLALFFYANTDDPIVYALDRVHDTWAYEQLNISGSLYVHKTRYTFTKYLEKIFGDALRIFKEGRRVKTWDEIQDLISQGKPTLDIEEQIRLDKAFGSTDKED